MEDAINSTYNLYPTYPQFKVAHPMYYAKCLTSSNTGINTTSIQLHEKAFSDRTKPV